jgi:hypothetical protein
MGEFLDTIKGLLSPVDVGAMDKGVMYIVIYKPFCYSQPHAKTTPIRVRKRLPSCDE